MTALVERHLFGPGPSNPYPEATAALALPCSATSTRRSCR
jgi:alanine-glyoxylate transaminase / serine-glyoxylate transaminase / serine-pyruvate transaminase